METPTISCDQANPSVISIRDDWLNNSNHGARQSYQGVVIRRWVAKRGLS